MSFDLEAASKVAILVLLPISIWIFLKGVFAFLYWVLLANRERAKGERSSNEAMSWFDKYGFLVAGAFAVLFYSDELNAAESRAKRKSIYHAKRIAVGMVLIALAIYINETYARIGL